MEKLTRQLGGRALGQIARGFLLAAFVMSGCSSETGILIEVTVPEELSDIQVDKLEFFVEAIAPNQTATRLGTQAPGADFASGRNLFAKPYLLMVRPGDIGEDFVMVAAVGFVGADPDGRLGGALAQPVRFAQGEVRKWTITLDWLSVDAGGCVTIQRESGSIKVGPADDYDCDGQTALDGDCDDFDRNTYLGAPEVCDGRVNTCVPGDFCDAGFDQDTDFVTTCGSILDAADNSVCLSGRDDTAVDCSDDPMLDGNAPLMTPGKVDVCGDGINNDCLGCEDDPPDEDLDGYELCGSVGACGADPWFRDCVDTDNRISPGQLEICDGFDTNCAGPTLSGEVCYAYYNSDGECGQGRISCDDTTPATYSGSCQLLANAQVPDGLCVGYASCLASPDRLGCTYGMVQTTEVTCVSHWVVDFTLTPTMCSSPPAILSSSANGCSWRIHGGMAQAVYNVSLFEEGSSVPTDETDACDSRLKIDGASRPRPDRFILEKYIFSGAVELFEVHIEPVVGTSCPEAGPAFDCGPMFPPGG